MSLTKMVETKHQNISTENANTNESSKIKVLHLLGSSASPYYFSISKLYAQKCMSSATSDSQTMAEFDFYYAVVHPNGETPLWSFPEDLSDKAIDEATRYSHIDGIHQLGRMAPDVVVPHMFCLSGLTHFRSLCELLGFQFLGGNAAAQSIAENKALNRLVLKNAGVPVAEGEVLAKGQNEVPSIDLPFIVKPNCEGNSKGVSLVSAKAEVEEALRLGFIYDDVLLVEKYIPLGKELRVGCIEEDDGSIRVLPAIEYIFKNNTIRTPDSKLQCNDGGQAVGWSSITHKCPADLDTAFKVKLDDFIRKAHRALGCQDFSLYDVRVDPDGSIFFLESTMYCSFSLKSAIIIMATATEDIKVQEFFRRMVRRAAKRGKDSRRLSHCTERSMKGKVITQY